MTKRDAGEVIVVRFISFCCCCWAFYYLSLLPNLVLQSSPTK
jgi:hypothetical protein